MANKYSLAGLGGIADRFSAANKKATQSSYVAAALPSLLKERFDKSRSKDLDVSIAKKEQQVLGGAIEGLNKYSNISDPFARRALAEKYQSGLSVGLSSLTTEKDRRTQKFADYLDKWSGLYGAEAAKRQAEASAIQSEFTMQSSLYDKQEAKRTSGDKFKTYSDEEVTQTISRMKADGDSWQDIADSLREQGVDVTTGSHADVQLNSVFETGNYPTVPKKYKETNPKERTQKQQFEDKEYQRLNEIRNKAKKSRSAAKYGEYYVDSTGSIKKKIRWGSDEIIYEN